MGRLFQKMLLTLAILAESSVPLHACTVCESETGVQVRQGIFGKNFLPSFFATVAPFALIAAVVIGIAIFPEGPQQKGKR